MVNILSLDELRAYYLPILKAELANDQLAPTIARLEELGFGWLRPHILAHGGMAKFRLLMGYPTDHQLIYEAIRHLCKKRTLPTYDDLAANGYSRVGRLIHQSIGTRMFADSVGLRTAMDVLVRRELALDRLVTAVALKLSRLPLLSDFGPRVATLVRRSGIRQSIERTRQRSNDPGLQQALDAILNSRLPRSPDGYWTRRRTLQRLRPEFEQWVKQGCQPCFTEFLRQGRNTALIRHVKLKLGTVGSLFTNPAVASEEKIQEWLLVFIRSEVERTFPELAERQVMPARREFMPLAPRADHFILRFIKGYQKTARLLGWRSKRLGKEFAAIERTVDTLSLFAVNCSRLPIATELPRDDRRLLRRHGGPFRFLAELAETPETRPLVESLVETCQDTQTTGVRSYARRCALRSLTQQLACLIANDEEQRSAS